MLDNGQWAPNGQRFLSVFTVSSMESVGRRDLKISAHHRMAYSFGSLNELELRQNNHRTDQRPVFMECILFYMLNSMYAVYAACKPLLVVHTAPSKQCATLGLLVFSLLVLSGSSLNLQSAVRSANEIQAFFSRT